jgi:hypothetical protein
MLRSPLWMAGSSPRMRGIFLVDFLNDRTIFLFVVSIEGASRGVRVAGSGRRLRSGSQPDLGRLWVTVRGHYGPLPSMAGMETSVRRKKRLRLKSSVLKGSRGLRKKSAGSRKRGPGALWEERRRERCETIVPRKRSHNEDRCVSQRSLPSNLLPRGLAGCGAVPATPAWRATRAPMRADKDFRCLTNKFRRRPLGAILGRVS